MRIVKKIVGQWSRRRARARRLKAFIALLDASGRPRPGLLSAAAGDLDPLSMNVKHFGYGLARRLARDLPVQVSGAAEQVGLTSRLSTQADIESGWAAHWCAELRIPVIYHRKIWELAFVLQAIFESGHLRDGARGLGFGCGMEPIASYLCAHGVRVTATDLPASHAHARGWAASDQHADHLMKLFHSHLVEQAVFERRASLRFADMNAIPADLRDYDFCWSICALEHLGSIAKGVAFIENSLATLRPGGVAVHTTEFEISEQQPPIDDWPTVLFQRRHIVDLAERLRTSGHLVAPLDLSLGAGPLDRFVDVPPWSHDLPAHFQDWLGEPLHLKVAIEGRAATCLGIIVRKAG